MDIIRKKFLYFYTCVFIHESASLEIVYDSSYDAKLSMP